MLFVPAAATEGLLRVATTAAAATSVEAARLIGAASVVGVSPHITRGAQFCMSQNFTPPPAYGPPELDL